MDEIEMTISIQDKHGRNAFTRRISAAEPHPELRLTAKLIAILSDCLVETHRNADLEPIAQHAVATAHEVLRREGVDTATVLPH